MLTFKLLRRDVLNKLGVLAIIKFLLLHTMYRLPVMIQRVPLGRARIVIELTSTFQLQV